MPIEATESVVDHALRYARAGYEVLPVHGVRNGRCTCGAGACAHPGKHPRTEHGARDASGDENVIRNWFQRWPDANLGLALGGLVAVDVDPRNGGSGTLEALEREHGALPETCTQKTGGGGAHLLFRTANGAQYPGKLGPGVDLKSGAGSLIVVEPSVHASGGRYCWLDESGPHESGIPALAPDWLRVASENTCKHESHRATDKIVKGGRNEALSRTAYKLRKSGLGIEAITAALLAENRNRCDPPLPEDEVRSIAQGKAAIPPAPTERTGHAFPLDWAALATQNPPSRRWATDYWLGFDHVTLMPGVGGIGKTLLAQQWCSALSIGQFFIDESHGPLKCLMWQCEDDHDEIWRRQLAIARCLNTGLDAFTSNLIIVPRHGLDNALVASEFGRLQFTPLIEHLRQQAGDLKAEVVVLDNVAQLYGGSENDRHQVTAFLNALCGALPGRAVLLLAHPSRSPGSEYSGSSAWEAVVRTRLYLGRSLPDQKPDAGDEVDDDVRFLARRKANYGPRDWRRLTFKDGVLVPDPVEVSGGIVGHLQDKAVERVVLEGLKRLQEMGLTATDGKTSPRYLPRVLDEYKLGEGHTRTSLAAAMRRLMLANRLRRVEVGKDAQSHSIYGLQAPAIS